MVLSTMIYEPQHEQQHTRSGERKARDAPVGVLKENPNLRINA